MGLRLALALIAALGWSSATLADPLQERLDRIASDVTAMFEKHAQGLISEEELMQRTEELLLLDMRLRTGEIRVEELVEPRWRDVDEPFFTAGFELVIADLPEGFSDPIWATLPDGQRLDVEAYRAEFQGSTEITVSMPVHPNGAQHGDTLTFHFGGAEPLGSLQAELAPVLQIDNAFPKLMQLVTGLVVTDLEAAGISPEDLLAQFRAAPEAVDPLYSHAAALLWLWSEASRGNERLAYIRDGRLDSPFWTELGSDGLADTWNLAASAALQNMLTPELMLKPMPEVLQKIKAPAPPAQPRLIRANTGGEVTQTTLPNLAELVVRGRDLQRRREVWLGSLKSTHKLLDTTLAWTPDTIAVSGAIGGGLTLADQALRNQQRNFPNTISIRIDPDPNAVLKADDSRILDLQPTLIGKSPPYKGLKFADGLDVGLLVADTVLSLGSLTKYGKWIDDIPDPQAVALAKTIFAGKETVEQIEKRGPESSYKIIELPGRTWEAPISNSNHAEYFSVSYGGEVAQPGRRYYGKACWHDTGEGASATILANSSKFAGLYARETTTWPVEAPSLTITPDDGVLEPGESTFITFARDGAKAQNIRAFPPPLGTLSDVSNYSAIYTAPSEIASCSEAVTLEAEYPTGPEAANICTAPPRFVGTVFIKKGDAQVSTPSELSCRDGEVLDFTVSHPDGKEVQCRLSGPGRLTMDGNKGVLDCPVQPRQSSAITCYTGQIPGQCAPVIPIKRIFPEFAVSALVTADREEPLNDNVESFFDDCGVEDMTSVALELMDLGTGAADGAPVDPISGDCPNPMLAAVPGMISGTVDNSSTPNEPETFAVGRYVSNYPLGQARDTSVADTNSYRHSPYDPGRGPGDRSVLVTSDFSADVTFQSPEQFIVHTNGNTVATSIREADEMPVPSGGRANWAVWRRIVVTRDTIVTASVKTSGPATTLVQAVPLRLQDNVPLMLLAGFDQNLTPVMMVGTTTSAGLAAVRSDSGSVILPGPRRAGDRLTYLIMFNGAVQPSPDGDNRVTAVSRTDVTLDIRPFP